MLPSPHLVLPVFTDLQTRAILFTQTCFGRKSEVERKFDILQEIAFIFVTQQPGVLGNMLPFLLKSQVLYVLTQFLINQK